MAIWDWSTSAGNNNSAPPDGAPEGMAPGSVNDVLREMMAQVAGWYTDAEWIQLTGTYTFSSFASGVLTFTTTGDVTATFPTGLCLEYNDGTAHYCSVTSATYSSPTTTIVANVYSGTTPTTNPTTLKRGILSPDNQSASFHSVIYPQSAGEIAAGVTPPNLEYHWYNVKRFGAKGDGSTDDTVAIDNCWKCLARSGYSSLGAASWMDGGIGEMYFPAGDYVYNGTGLTDAHSSARISIKVKGDWGSTRIRLSTGNYFIEPSSFVVSISLRNLHFYGGAGAIKETYSSANVSAFVDVQYCWFDEYEEIAVGAVGSTDRPFYRIKNNAFTGKVSTANIGISVPPGGNHDISANWFNRGKYYIKLNGEQLVDCAITRNRFGNLGNTIATTAIWIVPTTSTISTGRGIYIDGNWFGSENHISGDLRVIVAEESTTTSHSLSNSTKYAHGIIFGKNNVIASGAAVDQPVIKSYTENLLEYQIDAPFFEGSLPPSILDIIPSISDSNYRSRDAIINIGPYQNSGQKKTPVPTTAPAVVIDPLGNGYRDNRPQFWATGHDDGMAKLITSDHAYNNVSLANATKATATDVTGGDDAATITFTTSAGQALFTGATTYLNANRVAWAEIDLKVAASTPIDFVMIDVRISAANRALYRVVPVPGQWTRFRWLFIPSQASSAYSIAVTPFSTSFSSGVSDSVIIGRPRLYHAKEPLNFGMLSGGAIQTTVGAAGGASALPATPTGYIKILVNGTLRVIPYYNAS